MSSSFEEWQVTSNDSRDGSVTATHRHFGPKPGLRIAVHMVQGRTGWHMTCHPMEIFHKPLSSVALDDAQQEATDIVVPWLEEVLRDMLDLI